MQRHSRKTSKVEGAAPKSLTVSSPPAGDQACSCPSSLPITVTMLNTLMKAAWGRISVTSVTGYRPQLRGSQGRNSELLVTSTVKSKENEFMCANSCWPPPDTVTCCGLCPPTSIGVIKTSPYRHPHRRNCSRQALLEILFPGDMMLCQVDQLIKMSHHIKYIRGVCFISKHNSIPYPACLGQKSFIRFWIFLICATFACI